MVKGRTRSDLFNSVSTLILWCFFLSGFTGLVYEILWTRMTVQLIGGAPFAVSIVLTVFMGGLGFGSYLAGRIIDRISRPEVLVRAYGILELVIGAFGFMIPVFLKAVKPLQEVLYNALYEHFVFYNLLTFVICAIILCVPVICMGATLPLLCRFYISRLSDFGTRAGRLYGLNTIGAACGALVCGFWLINNFGVNSSLLVIVLINAVIGLSCIVASTRVKIPAEIIDPVANTAKDTGTTQVNPADHGSERDSYNRSIGQLALVVFVISGFCSMASEVLWTRLLGLLVGPTTYSFTIVLVTFISGLALGSMIFGRLGDKTRDCMRLLLYTQLAAALLVLAVSQVLGGSQMFFAKLIYTFKDNFLFLNVLKVASLFGFMVLPTLCFGATFPLVGKLYTPSLMKVGRSIGFAYMLNSIGALLGAFCAGFIIIPLVGKELGLSLIVGLQLIAVLTIAVIISKRGQLRRVHLVATAGLSLVGLILCFIYPTWNHIQLSTGKYHRFSSYKAEIANTDWLTLLLRGPSILADSETGDLVFYGEGVGGFTTVVKYFDLFGDDHFIMANSGKADASSRSDMITQTLSAHFPMLFHRDPKKVMVLGHASGVTAGEVLHYDIEQLDILEISEEVIEASRIFHPWNNNVLEHPTTNIILQDGRAHLDLTRQRYDVIISEPSNPWMAGLAALFTDEFFRLVRDKLGEDGIFIQWIQSYQTNWETFALVTRTFAGVFPNSMLVLTSPTGSGGDYLLVGFNGDQRLALEKATGRMKNIRQSTNVDLRDPRLLYRLIVSEDLPALCGPGEINTDTYPRLEYLAPKLLHSIDKQIAREITAKKNGGLSPEVKAIVSDLTGDVDSQIDFAAYALSLYHPFSNMVDLSRATAEQRTAFTGLLVDYCTVNEMDCALISDAELKSQCLASQAATIERRVSELDTDEVTPTYLGGVFTNFGVSYASDGHATEAIKYYHKALAINPGYQKAHANLAVALVALGRTDEAITHYEEALRIDPDYAQPHHNLGLIRAERGDLAQAISHFEQALRDSPDFTEAHHSLGLALANQNNLPRAIDHYVKAIESNPGYAPPYNDLGIALTRQNRLDDAITYFTVALRINPEDSVAHNNMAITLVQQGKLATAIEHWREAIRINPDYSDARNNLQRALALRD
jgi:spermidine synthase